MKPIFVIAISLFCFSCKVDTEQIYTDIDKEYFETGKVLSCRDALKQLEEKDEKIILVQVSPSTAFEREHIPNSTNIWRPDYGSDQKVPYGGLLPSKHKIERLLQNLNYRNGKTLLLYDLKGNVDALRFAWVLKYYGISDFKIINGGLTYWKALNYPVDKGVEPILAKSNFRINHKVDDSVIAMKNDVLNALKDTSVLIVDTRESHEYLGQPFVVKKALYKHKKGAFDRGSIPGAIHFNWSNLVDLEGDHRFKTPKDMRHDLLAAGIDKNKEILLYCQSGSRTSHTYFVLTELLGYPNVRNYDGSWIEWSYWHKYDNSIPIEQITNELLFEDLYKALKIELDYEIRQ